MAITFIRADTDSDALGVDLTFDAEPASGAAINVGDVMLSVCGCSGTTLPTTPAGWTVPTDGTENAAVSRVVCYRVKEAGDDVFTWEIPGTAGSNLAVAVFRGAAFGELDRGTNQVASGNSWLWDALTVDGSSASVLIGSASGNPGTVTPPSGYTELVTIGSSWIGWDSTISAGSLDPDDATFTTARTHRLGWHVELTDPTAPLTSAVAPQIGRRGISQPDVLTVAPAGRRL